MSAATDSRVFRPFWDAESLAAFERLVALINEQDAGVAFLGAGLSAPSYPSWSELYTLLREFAIKNAAGATGDDFPVVPKWGYETALQVIEDAVGTDVFLAEIRRTFGPNGAALPQAYSVLCSMPHLEIVTWNIEEFLATAANHAGRVVSAYPTFEKHFVQQKVTYLHGRLATAETTMDVVLGRRAYDHAYRDGGDLQGMLRGFFWQRPVVFVGTSLSDPVFLPALDRLRALRSQFDGVSVARVVPLQLFTLMKAESAAQVRSDTSQLRARDITPIWYADDAQGGHGELLHVLDLLKNRTTRVSTNEPPSADVIPLLNAAERLARVSAPSPEDEALATRLLANEVFARAFYRAAPTEGWFSFLYAAGHLTPDEPTPVAAGGSETNWWNGGDYLEGLVRSGVTARVTAFLQELRTDNWLALTQVGRMLRALPIHEAMSLAEPLKAWMSTPFAAQSRIASDALDVLGAGAAAGEANLAEFAEPLLDSIFGEKEAPSSEYLARRLRDDVVPQLIEAGAARGIFTASREDLGEWLQREWGDDPEEDASAVQRPAIEEHSQNSYLRRLDYLVEIARDTLRALEADSEYARLLTETYRSSWPLVRRLALHEARMSPAGFSVLAPELEADLKDLLFNVNVYHEVSLLIASLDSAPPSFVTSMQSMIDEGDPDRDEESRGRWHRRWLHLTPEWMLTEAQQAERATTPPPFDTDADSRFFLFYSSGVFHPTAPATQSDFDTVADPLSNEDVLDLVRHPARYGIEVTVRHDTEQMWDRLIDYAGRRGRIQILFMVTAADLEGRGAWKVVQAALRSLEEEADWLAALQWLGMLAASKGTAAWAVGDALRDDVVERAPLTLIDEIVRLARTLIEQEFTPLDEDLGADADFGGHRDLMFRELNRAAGKGAWALLGLTDRVRTQEALKGMPAWLMEIAHDSASEGWGGIEVRVALGSLFPVLRIVDQASADTLKPSLMPAPTDRAALNARTAFWTGYLYRGEVSSEDLRYFLDDYAAELGSPSLELLQEELQARLIDHIVVGVLREVAGFDVVVETILSITERAELRRQVAQSFGRFLGERENVARALAHWKRHLELSGDTENLDLYFGWLHWLDELPDFAEPVLSLIERTVRPTPPEQQVFGVFRYLQSAVDWQPAMALKVLDHVVESWSGAPEFRWFTREAVAIVLALGKTDAAAEDEYRALVQRLLAAGHMTLADGNAALGLQPN